MPESWAYRATGARITYIADDWLEVRVRLALTWRTRNYVGTLFGGSLYGAVDPIYMVMLIRALGPEFVVWDQAATVRFLRPGRSTLHATFRLGPDQVGVIAADARAKGRVSRDFEIALVDAEGRVCLACTKTIFIRHRTGSGTN